MKPIKRFDGEIYRRSTDVIAHGALTNSKRPESFVKGIYPTHLKKGQGAYVWDTLDNKYIDFIGALGTSLLGYAEEEVTEAIHKQAKLGVTLSLGTQLEIEYAERLKGLFPYMEKIRILKSGTEGCMAALRIARAYSHEHGKHSIVTEGYHGWGDEFVRLTQPANGVVASTFYIHKFEPFRLDPEALSGVAAVIIEPVMTDFSDERLEWLKKLRRTTHLQGTLLIFDETITALRFPGYSVANHTGVIPDLSIMGKALANGCPISIVGGKAHVMDSDYFVSSTFAGETLSMAAGMKVLDLLNGKYQISYLWEMGRKFKDAFNSLWSDGLTLEGYPTRSVFNGNDETKALFFQESCKAGILVGPSFFFSFPHITLIDEVLSTFRDILIRIKLGQVKLEGEMPRKPYAQKMREAA